MRRNLSELEQRLILLLKRNSRMSIVDIASELGTSRLTAKKALDSIISSGRIKKFTISIADEEKDMVLVYTDNLENIPELKKKGDTVSSGTSNLPAINSA